MENIDINQVGQHFPALVEKSVLGNDIIITKKGLPIAKIIGLSKLKKQRKFDSAKGLIKISDDFNKPLEDFKD